MKKVIITSGAAAVGKTWLLSQLNLHGLPIINPDKYVEGEGDSLSVGSKKAKKEVEHAIEEARSFVWDTTATKSNKVENLLEKGYEVCMLVVYTHPYNAFISNFMRGRSVPKTSVFELFNSVYNPSLQRRYKQMLGDNYHFFVNLRTDFSSDKIKEFNEASKKGTSALKKFLDKIIAINPQKFKTSFSKPFSIEDKQVEKRYEEETQHLRFDKEDESIQKQLQRHFMKKWSKDGVGPGKDSMRTKLKAIYRQRDRRQKKYIEALEGICSGELRQLPIELEAKPIDVLQAQHIVDEFLK